MIVGLTGGIGSGKSTVLQCFKNLGASTYIADIEAKKIMNSDKKLKSDIINLLGAKAYQNNVIDRKYIADIIFNNPTKLQKLNKWIHPKVKQHFSEFAKKHLNSIVIYESAILFESKSNFQCDFIITVVADYKTRIKRIQLRDGASETEIKARMRNQITDNHKIIKSNFVITNTSLKYTKFQVGTAYAILQKMNIR
jgi:dephospho-CoA kinase